MLERNLAFCKTNRSLKKSVSIVTLIFALLASSVYAYTFYNQKKTGIRQAVAERPDLTGKDKKSVIMRFGQPILKKVVSSKMCEKEIWIYKPFRFGRTRINITFIDGIVTGIEYSDE